MARRSSRMLSASLTKRLSLSSNHFMMSSLKLMPRALASSAQRTARLCESLGKIAAASSRAGTSAATVEARIAGAALLERWSLYGAELAARAAERASIGCYVDQGWAHKQRCSGQVRCDGDL